MRKLLFTGFSLTLAAILFSGCSLFRGEGAPTPTPTFAATPYPTAASPPVRRISFNDVKEYHYYSVGGKKVGVAIVNENGQAFLPVREWASACVAMKLRNGDFVPVWSFTNRNISIRERIESGCVLLNQTGYIELSQATTYLARDSLEVDEQILSSQRNFQQ